MPVSYSKGTTSHTFVGAIDVHARFTFVDVPAEYADRLLERIRNVQIRSTPIVVKRATPDDGRAHAAEGAPRPKRPKGRHAA